MDLPPTVELLSDLEQRQDEVLRGLDELNDQIEVALAAFHRELKVFSSIPVSA